MQKWAVDLNKHACDSLRLNHPETQVYIGCRYKRSLFSGYCVNEENVCITQVRNEYASDFLLLLKEWEQLCVSCSLVKSSVPPHPHLKVTDDVEKEENDDEDEDEESGDDQGVEVFEVEELLEVCYGDPKEMNKPGLYFKVLNY